MGECGCIHSITPAARMHGPNNYWFVVSYYPGCDFCDNAAGIHIALYSSQDLIDYDMERLPVLVVNSTGMLIPMIGPQDLAEVLHEELRPALEEALVECLPDAIQRVMDKWGKDVKGDRK